MNAAAKQFLNLWYPRYHAMLEWLCLTHFKNAETRFKCCGPPQRYHPRTRSMTFFHTQNDTEMIKPSGQFTSKQLLLDPTHARRVISLRTFAACLTLQHLLADRLTARTQAGWKQTISYRGITLFSIVGLFYWARSGKAGKLLINIPFRVASSAGRCGWKDCWFNCSNLNFQGKKEHTLLLAALTQVCIVDQVWLYVVPLGYCKYFFLFLLKYYHILEHSSSPLLEHST